MKMRIIECVGYKGYKCRKKVRATSNRQKRCPNCAIKARILVSRAWSKANPGYGLAWRKTNRNAIRIRMKAWYRARYKDNSGKMRAKQRTQYKANPTSRRESSWRSIGIITKDGNTLTYKKFKQDSKSGCKLKFLGNCAGLLGADHDHETGLYRGPLCLNHNHALGKLGDTVKTLKRIIRILEGK